jgi:hypothetical protein
MKISGFTVIRNGVLMGYPVLQSIQSVLPLVDEFVVGVGQSDDGTRELIEKIGDSRIKIFDSFWDTAKTKGGLILSEKTNEALARCAHDWCFYIQADEVAHEADLPLVRQALEAAERQPSVQGLLFRYVHFYGSYATVATSRRWYRNEVRVVRKSCGIQSHNDAQGFRVRGEKPIVARANARIFHYGWVKPPTLMGQKSKLLSRWWHGSKKDKDFDDFKYARQYGLKPFVGTHPKVMQPLVDAQDWAFEYRRGLADWTLKDVNLAASDAFERVFGHRIGEYKPYRLAQAKESEGKR